MRIFRLHSLNKRAVRLNNSSCQVYMSFKKGEAFDPCGDLIFTSVDGVRFERLSPKILPVAPFDVLPDIRPGQERYVVVSSTNANWNDWARLSDEYQRQATFDRRDDRRRKYVPGARRRRTCRGCDT